MYIFTEPDKPPEISPYDSPSNNVLHVKCKSPQNWNGDSGFYEAVAEPGNIRMKWSQRCDFKFDSLSYSTEYTISVCKLLNRFSRKAARQSFAIHAIPILLYMHMLSAFSLQIKAKNKQHFISDAQSIKLSTRCEYDFIVVERNMFLFHCFQVIYYSVWKCMVGLLFQDIFLFIIFKFCIFHF